MGNNCKKGGIAVDDLTVTVGPAGIAAKLGHCGSSCCEEEKERPKDEHEATIHDIVLLLQYAKGIPAEQMLRNIRKLVAVAESPKATDDVVVLPQFPLEPAVEKKEDVDPA